jgi:hypothetical protein
MAVAATGSRNWNLKNAGETEEGDGGIVYGSRPEFTDDHMPVRPKPGTWSKVLPSSINRLRHGRTAKHVDASPFCAKGGYSPMTGRIVLHKRVRANRFLPPGNQSLAMRALTGAGYRRSAFPVDFGELGRRRAELSSIAANRLNRL